MQGRIMQTAWKKNEVEKLISHDFKTIIKPQKPKQHDTGMQTESLSTKLRRKGPRIHRDN